MKTKMKNKNNSQPQDEKNCEENEEDEVIFETESFRVRKPNKKLTDEIKEHEDSDIKIKYKDLELNLCGFNLAKNKEGKLIFGYKVKPQDRGIIIHIPKDLAKEDEIKIKDIVRELHNFADGMGFEVMDSWEFIKRVYSEKHILDKIGDKDNGN